MKTTLIIECNRCGNLLLAPDNQKTRTCPYCNKRLNVQKTKHVASAKNAFQASELLKTMKQQKGFNHKNK